MDKDTLWQELTKIAKYYGAKNKTDAEVLNIYYDHLKDMDYDTFKNALDRHIETGKFFPTIADIREAAMLNVIRRAGVPAPDEAWGEVSAALSNDHQENFGTLTDVNRLSDHAFSHPLIKEAVEKIGWQDMYFIHKTGGATGFASNRARFMDSYREKVSKLKEHYSLTPNLRAAIDPIEQPQLPTPDESEQQIEAMTGTKNTNYVPMPERHRKRLDEILGKKRVA